MKQIFVILNLLISLNALSAILSININKIINVNYIKKRKNTVQKRYCWQYYNGSNMRKKTEQYLTLMIVLRRIELREVNLIKTYYSTGRKPIFAFENKV